MHRKIKHYKRMIAIKNPITKKDNLKKCVCNIFFTKVFVIMNEVKSKNLIGRISAKKKKFSYFFADLYLYKKFVQLLSSL